MLSVPKWVWSQGKNETGGDFNVVIRRAGPPEAFKVLVAQSCLTLRDPIDCSLPGSSVHGISRQKYWSGEPFPSPGDLLHPGIKPRSPALQADSLPSEPWGKAKGQHSWNFKGQSSRWRERSELKGRKTQEEFFPYNPDKNNRYLD